MNFPFQIMIKKVRNKAGISGPNISTATRSHVALVHSYSFILSGTHLCSMAIIMFTYTNTLNVRKQMHFLKPLHAKLCTTHLNSVSYYFVCLREKKMHYISTLYLIFVADTQFSSSILCCKF